MTSQDDNLLKLWITSVKQETAIAKTYTLERLDGESVRFLPGQFLTFIINTGKQEVRRSYSILNLPGEPLQVTVKKVTNGLISRYILQTWHTGHIVTSLFPSGRFTLPVQQIARDIFCFAAGSGIVPILPQIRHLLRSEKLSIIHLIYSNHNEGDTLFDQKIRLLAKQNSRFKIHYFFSEPTSPGHQRRRLSNLNTELLVNELLTFPREHAAFLISGPFAYMRMLLFTLGLMGFKKENIRKESFITQVKNAGKAEIPDLPDTEVKIKLLGKEHRIIVHTGETILSAALKQGLKPPYSCEGGVCGTCVAKCTGGSVYMSINEVLPDSEIKEGLVLTCTGYPMEGEIYLVF